MKNYPILLLFFLSIVSYSFITAQPVTGFWKGKIDRKNVELKIVKNGDSITGTSYYYESAKSYRRFSIKGYFDDRDNSVVWWDDQLIEEKKSKGIFTSPASVPYVSTTDFNCPGGTKMYLNGRAALKENEQERGPVDLEKSGDHVFNDEWDFVIDNYTVGTNDPELIDSIGKMAFNKPVPLETPMPKEMIPKPSSKDIAQRPKIKTTGAAMKKEPVATKNPEQAKAPVIAATPLNNVQKFNTRRKVLLQEIPVTSSDSIELRFYDNAEVDGDSIAIFLNDNLLHEHIRLTEKAYTIKLAVADLKNSNELVMVAENLGSIPPNTSLMIAMVDGKRYEARLESTEQSSAAIRFVRRQMLLQ